MGRNLTKPFLFLVLCLCLGVSGQKMEQSPQSLNIQEGEKAVLTCNYTQFSPVVFQWYRQDPGRGLVFLLLIRENEGEKQTGRLTATFDKTVKRSSFHITESQPADSATYFCAADTQQGPATCFLCPNSAKKTQSIELLAVLTPRVICSWHIQWRYSN
uniref:Ig-like domain-containing protein n=1 Tax=Suricata suricatta TaxID=37032 RepID=A0A673TJN5_SURSU